MHLSSSYLEDESLLYSKNTLGYSSVVWCNQQSIIHEFVVVNIMHYRFVITKAKHAP